MFPIIAFSGISNMRIFTQTKGHINASLLQAANVIFIKLVLPHKSKQRLLQLPPSSQFIYPTPSSIPLHRIYPLVLHKTDSWHLIVSGLLHTHNEASLTSHSSCHPHTGLGFTRTQKEGELRRGDGPSCPPAYLGHATPTAPAATSRLYHKAGRPSTHPLAIKYIFTFIARGTNLYTHTHTHNIHRYTPIISSHVTVFVVFFVFVFVFVFVFIFCLFLLLSAIIIFFPQSIRELLQP